MARITGPLRIEIEPHPRLRVAIFSTSFPAPLGELETPERVRRLLRGTGPPPIDPPPDIRTTIRDVLRMGGYKPTGRGKPASEYLRQLATKGPLSSINAAVDTCNAVSLHSGLPISVVDLGIARDPFYIAIAQPGTRYVFNTGGQEIEVGGLVCLHDVDGPCANPVRDSQRTKTLPTTTSTLSVLWGAVGLEGHLEAASDWYRDLLTTAGAITSLLDV